MKKSINIPNWYKNNRLKSLRNKHGYNQTYVANAINCVLKTYQNYEQGHNFPTLEYADALANLYGVSIDYLLGRSDCHSIENTHIKKKIGLNDNALKQLANWNKYENEMRQQLRYSSIDTLNMLFQDSLDFEFLLRHIQDLFNTQYRYPVYHNESNEPITSNNEIDNIKSAFSPNDIPILNLASDKNTPWDNYPVVLNDTFFESVALKGIEKRLHEINDYIKNNTDK